MPSDFVLNTRNLVREYYRLKDQMSAYVNKLTSALKVSFPEYLGISSKITTNTSLALLDKHPSPDMLLVARKPSVIKLIRKTACFGEAYAEKQYEKLLAAAKAAKVFGHSLPSDANLIKLYISLIRTYNKAVDGILLSIKAAVESRPDELFVKQIRLLESIKGSLLSNSIFRCINQRIRVKQHLHCSFKLLLLYLKIYESSQNNRCITTP